MGFILSLCGFGVYQAIVHAHWQILDRELESVAGTLHDKLIARERDRSSIPSLFILVSRWKPPIAPQIALQDQYGSVKAENHVN